MAFGVTTEELSASARSLRTDGEHQQLSQRDLRDGAGRAPSWAVGRACRAAQAFFDTIADAALRSGTGLTALGDRLGAAAGEYDAVESRVTRAEAVTAIRVHSGASPLMGPTGRPTPSP